jgi:hypothetical protein
MLIEITCKTKKYLHIDELETFQGIDEESMTKLKESILKYGFSFPIFVWRYNILDGHQRLKAVKMLIDDGHEMDDQRLPVVEIEAKNEKEAAEKLLLINSRYAKISQEGFDSFTVDFDIDLSDIEGLLEIPEIDLSFEANENILEDFKEIDEQELANKCPKCGFEFD